MYLCMCMCVPVYVHSEVHCFSFSKRRFASSGLYISNANVIQLQQDVCNRGQCATCVKDKKINNRKLSENTGER